MGLEASCRVRHGSRQSEGKARLEEKELTFRGDFNLKIPFSEMTEYEARQGALRIVWRGGEAFFELGSEKAEKWRLKIRYPRSLIDKLGVKPGQNVLVLGVKDESFWTLLRDRTERVSQGSDGSGFDWVFLQIGSQEELSQLADLRGRIQSGGSIWVLWPKGRPQLKEDHVRAAALKSGLVDVKVVSFSELLSGLKLMIPKNLRRR